MGQCRAGEKALFPFANRFTGASAHLLCAVAVRSHTVQGHKKLSNMANPCYALYKIGQSVLRPTSIMSGLPLMVSESPFNRLLPRKGLT